MVVSKNIHRFEIQLPEAGAQSFISKLSDCHSSAHTQLFNAIFCSIQRDIRQIITISHHLSKQEEYWRANILDLTGMPIFPSCPQPLDLQGAVDSMDDEDVAVVYASFPDPAEAIAALRNILTDSQSVSDEEWIHHPITNVELASDAREQSFDELRTRY